MDQQLDLPSHQPGPTVLLVEDDQDTSEAISELLRGAGYRVVCAPDGRAALRLLWSGSVPAALIVDLFLPMMNGWQLCAELRLDHALCHVPIIVVTAAGDYWGYPVPPDLVVRKPFNSDRLLRLLRSAIRLPP
jgi:two-component system, NtrC family, sensor kinase